MVGGFLVACVVVLVYPYGVVCVVWLGWFGLVCGLVGGGWLMLAVYKCLWDFPFRCCWVGGWVPGCMWFGVGLPIWWWFVLCGWFGLVWWVSGWLVVG